MESASTDGRHLTTRQSNPPLPAATCTPQSIETDVAKKTSTNAEKYVKAYASRWRINSSTPIANYRARQSVMEKYAKPEK